MNRVPASKLVRAAIYAERAAAQFHTQAAEKVGHPKLRNVLLCLAEMDRRQADECEFTMPLLIGSPETVVEFDGVAPDWVLPPEQREQEALRTALAMEQRMAQYYEELGKSLGGAASQYFKVQARAEEVHALLLEQTVRDPAVVRERRFSFQQALRAAVQAEHACAWFFEEMAAKSHNGRVRKFFGDMARFERARITEIERTGAKIPDAPALGHPSPFVKNLPSFRYSQDVTLAEALKIALEAQHRGARHYANLSGQFSGDCAHFFYKLSRAEEAHGNMIRRTLEGMFAEKAA